MLNYYKDFKRERFHDDNLIELISILSKSSKLDIFEKTLNLNIGALGSFVSSRKKRDFDVLLEFDNYNIIIETKVDSPEGGNRSAGWQTNKIYNKYNKCWPNKKKIFIYLTYGLSEFYIKKRSDGSFNNGSTNVNFSHLKCNEVQYLIESAINNCSIKDNRLINWNKWLKFELNKRIDNQLYLKDVKTILDRYKKELNLTDYPVNRLNLFLPEFTIPFFFKICDAWNKLNHPKIGKACLYPMGRGSASTNDSILNFSEFWKTQNITMGGLLSTPNSVYFEFNEDFNLHLKTNGNIKNIEEIRTLLEKQHNSLSNGFNSTVEYYKQGAFVIYEWDLNILKNNINTNLNNIESIITNAIIIIK
jgi:hypothetical protein